MIPPLENDGCSGIPKLLFVCVGSASNRHIHIGATPPDWERFKQIHRHGRGLRDRRFDNYGPILKRFTEALSQAESSFVYKVKLRQKAEAPDRQLKNEDRPKVHGTARDELFNDQYLVEKPPNISICGLHRDEHGMAFDSHDLTPKPCCSQCQAIFQYQDESWLLPSLGKTRLQVLEDGSISKDFPHRCAEAVASAKCHTSRLEQASKASFYGVRGLTAHVCQLLRAVNPPETAEYDPWSWKTGTTRCIHEGKDQGKDVKQVGGLGRLLNHSEALRTGRFFINRGFCGFD